jgi:hypothetical protein
MSTNTLTVYNNYHSRAYFFNFDWLIFLQKTGAHGLNMHAHEPKSSMICMLMIVYLFI